MLQLVVSLFNTTTTETIYWKMREGGRKKGRGGGGEEAKLVRKGGLIWYTDGFKTKKALELGCTAMDQGGNLVLALVGIQRYSRQKCICH
jgi:hypothetical protein